MTRNCCNRAVADLKRLQGGRWDLPRCFIIHGWSPEYFRQVIRNIESALARNFYVDVDVSSFRVGESISQQALDAIEEAALVICILDGLAPNVVFELGYARALDKPIVLLVAEDAQVDVGKYFTKMPPPRNLKNPPLDFDRHFSDIRDLLRCPYDPMDPDSAPHVISQEFEKKSETTGESLSRRVIDAWVKNLARQYGGAGNFQALFDYIRQSTIDLTKPLFATTRRKRFQDLLEDGFSTAVQRGAQEPEFPLQDGVIEAIADLRIDQRLPLIRKLLEWYTADIRLRFAECVAVAEKARSQGSVEPQLMKEALRLHQAFLKEWPNVPNAHNNYALLLAASQRHVEAEQHFRCALELDSSFAEAWANLGHVYQDGFNEPGKARECYERALDIGGLPDGGKRTRRWLDQLNTPDGGVLQIPAETTDPLADFRPSDQLLVLIEKACVRPPEMVLTEMKQRFPFGHEEPDMMTFVSDAVEGLFSDHARGAGAAGEGRLRVSCDSRFTEQFAWEFVEILGLDPYAATQVLDRLYEEVARFARVCERDRYWGRISWDGSSIVLDVDVERSSDILNLDGIQPEYWSRSV